MRLSRRSVVAVAALAAGVLVAPFAVATSSAAAAVASAAPSAAAAPTPETREIPPGKTYALDPQVQAAREAKARSRTAAPTVAAATTPPVGTVRTWLAQDDKLGKVYRKKYTLRAVGKKIEVWVASDSDATSTGTAFPAGDCRTAVPGSTDITDAQAQALVDQFDNTMYPKESAAFSTPPNRDGTKAQLAGDYTGDGDKIVTLVDNIRDDNFYDFPARPIYIAGFFSAQFNELLDRNVMTIDAFDWKHRIGANPPDEPTSDLCTSRPARPFTYEGIFAHEYQHLLQQYTDPAEVSWINEGLSDFAISLTGYGNPAGSVFDARSEGHITCFNGFGPVKGPSNPNPRDCGGPENSLTRWGDEGTGNEILADYGNAWSFMLYLYDHYGQSFVSALHRDGKHQGLAAVQAQLDAFATKGKKGAKVADVIHDYQVMNLVDHTLGAKGLVLGVDRDKVTSKSLEARLNLDNPTSYRIPGAAPNGADYIAIRDPYGAVVPGRKLRSLSFTGAKTLPPLPLRWTVVTDAPGNEGNATLWSGNSSNLDAGAVVPVVVPTTNATLTFKERHLAEATYDYAYTMVSTDGGKTYTALANANTVAGPLGPALNGDAAAFATRTFDLSAYAGKSVLLAFRYVSDGEVNDGGWYVDDVAVGGTTISDGSTVAPFRSPTQVYPTAVANWSVRLVGTDEKTHRVLVLPVDGRQSFTIPPLALRVFDTFPMVVAIVAYDDPTERVQQFAPYTLKVNDVVQAGG